MAPLAAVAPGRPAHDRLPTVTRRTLQVVLGLFWLLDGALQLQPFMFGKGFAGQVIAPAAAGQPYFVSATVHWSASLILGHPVAWDVLFAAVQLAIGAGLLFRRTARPAVAVSLAWAAGVWYLGEGLGGLAGGPATFVTGAPGAVALYGLVGLAAWPRLGPDRRRQLLDRSAGWRSRARIGIRIRIRTILSVTSDEPPARWVPAAWAVTWGLFALLRALPANDSATALGSQVLASAGSSPGWLSSAQHLVGSALQHQGVGLVAAVVVAELAVGLLALRPGMFRQVAAWAGIAVALAVWVVGQAFGQISTGMGTDPSSAPLVVLLGVALLGLMAPERAGATVSPGAGGADGARGGRWTRWLREA
ncbi:MAG: hypothetical protein ACRDWN_05000 [Acidimicrobiales bacterium]